MARHDPLSPADRAWQERLLPLMVRMVVGLTVFFFLATLAQLVYLNLRIDEVPEVRSEVERLLDAYEGPGISLEYRVLAVLDANVLDQRYHQAAASLMARVWARYLGFITGMILALVGAVFILGKLREEATSVEGAGAGYSVGLRSSSPGLIMAVLGVILMVVTIVSHHEIETADSSVFLKLATPKPGEVVLPDTSFP